MNKSVCFCVCFCMSHVLRVFYCNGRRKTNAKVVDPKPNLTNHNRRKQRDEPIRIP